MDYCVKNTFNEEKGYWEVTVTGEVDIFNSTALKEILIQLVREKQADLFIDCRDLTYMDSTGLGALVAVLRNVKEFNGEIHLSNMRPNLGKLFKITNLDKAFIVEGDANE